MLTMERGRESLRCCPRTIVGGGVTCVDAASWLEWLVAAELQACIVVAKYNHLIALTRRPLVGLDAYDDPAVAGRQAGSARQA